MPHGTQYTITLVASINSAACTRHRLSVITNHHSPVARHAGSFVRCGEQHHRGCCHNRGHIKVHRRTFKCIYDIVVAAAMLPISHSGICNTMRPNNHSLFVVWLCGWIANQDTTTINITFYNTLTLAMITFKRISNIMVATALLPIS